MRAKDYIVVAMFVAIGLALLPLLAPLVASPADAPRWMRIALASILCALLVSVLILFCRSIRQRS